MTLSAALSNASAVTVSQLFLAEIIAASFTRLEISAPEKPGVKVDNLKAYSSIVFVVSSLTFFK